MTNDSTSLIVEVNGLDDFGRGRKLFDSFAAQVDRQGGGTPHGMLKSVGIIEQGTSNKKTSIALLCEVEINGKPVLVMAQTTAALFMSASMAVHGAIRKFETIDSKNKD